ncbi:unnamed protein product, partial [Nesidiocoris tenuis]
RPVHRLRVVSFRPADTDKARCYPINARSIGRSIEPRRFKRIDDSTDLLVPSGSYPTLRLSLRNPGKYNIHESHCGLSHKLLNLAPHSADGPFTRTLWERALPTFYGVVTKQLGSIAIKDGLPVKKYNAYSADPSDLFLPATEKRPPRRIMIPGRIGGCLLGRVLYRSNPERSEGTHPLCGKTNRPARCASRKSLIMWNVSWALSYSTGIILVGLESQRGLSLENSQPSTPEEEEGEEEEEEEEAEEEVYVDEEDWGEGINNRDLRAELETRDAPKDGIIDAKGVEADGGRRTRPWGDSQSSGGFRLASPPPASQAASQF